MNIAFINYYSGKSINLSASDGSRENGNLRFLELLKELDKEKINYEIYNKKNHNNYNLIIFFEIPNLLKLIFVKIKNISKKTPLILIIEETSVARSRNPLIIPFLFNEVLLNSENKNFRFKNYKTSIFSLGSLPSREEIISNKDQILNSNRLKKLVYIGTNKTALNKNSSYQFRTKIIKKISTYKNIFTLFGKGWDQRQIPMDFPFVYIFYKIKPLKLLLKKLINLNHFRVSSEGMVDSKIQTQNKFDFTLAIEPFIGYPLSILEKIFDPMLSGSIPIYFGPNQIPIPENCYLRIVKDTPFEKIIDLVNKTTLKEKNVMRQNIYNFLISKKADRYRYSTYAKFFIEKIKSYE